MKYVINEQVVLSHAPEGPFAQYLESFADSLAAQGYARYSIYRQVLLAACFSRWLKHQGIGARVMRTDHQIRFLRYRARRVRVRPGEAQGLEHFAEHLRCSGVICAAKIAALRLSSAERCVHAYEQYLVEVRALARLTIINYLPFIRCFLDERFGERQVRLNELCAGDVIKFVQRQAPRLHLKRAKLMTTALRSFLRYARYRGEVTLDLAAAVPIVANWSMTSIPRAICADSVRQLLASIDRRTALGRRDYAVLLLLARLGLRSSEVVLIELDDIDWMTGRLWVQGKGARRLELPLPVEVGEAIVAYLRDGRPPCASRRLFLRAKAPIRGFQGPCAVGSIVRHALERADIDAPSCGTHQFRHGLATDMLRRGASLAEIGELLGHRHVQTTKIYTKVDLEALRRLALPWPGASR
jgi:integrase/recombinase XerD